MSGIDSCINGEKLNISECLKHPTESKNTFPASTARFQLMDELIIDAKPEVIFSQHPQYKDEFLPH